MLLLVQCFCGIFGCDWGCFRTMCWFSCGFFEHIPGAGQLLSLLGICKNNCKHPPCGHAGDLVHPDLPDPAREPEPDPDCDEPNTGTIKIYFLRPCYKSTLVELPDQNEDDRGMCCYRFHSDNILLPGDSDRCDHSVHGCWNVDMPQHRNNGTCYLGL
jgi:hypothetical protein